MRQKVIFVTGTSSGFGWLIAKSCAELGSKVYATMRNKRSNNSVKANLLSEYDNVEVLEVELTSAQSVQEAVDTAIKNEGRIDVLINNAGVYATGLAETFTEHDLDKIMDVNLKGNWRTIKAVLPHMRRQGEGLIVNVSSVAGRFSTPFMSMYNSSKFALEGLIEALHYEVRPLGVDVVLLQPGAYPTEIFGKIISGSDASVLPGYGELAKIPEQMGAGVMQLFEAVKPNPQLVADAVVGLINTPNGKRPLRTVADVATGNIVEAANGHVAHAYANFLNAFGMQDLLA
jgi:NAD(P)-dependent dehydrogenase (short-subunit alcohol dehydrogenase family)